jgi:methyl-accepting chemotaxis protein
MSTFNQLIEKFNIDTNSNIYEYIQTYDSYINKYTENITKILTLDMPDNVLEFLNVYFKYAYIYNLTFNTNKSYDSNYITSFYAKSDDPKHTYRIIKKYGSNYDIIIDNYSTIISDQQQHLSSFFKHVKSNGYYFLNRLDTSSNKTFLKNKKHIKFNTFKVLSNFIKKKQINSHFITSDDAEYLNNTISKCDINILHKNLIMTTLQKNNNDKSLTNFFEILHEFSLDIKENIEELFEKITDNIDEVTDNIDEVTDNIIDNIDEVTDNINEVTDNIIDNIDEVTDNINEVTDNIIDNIDEVTDNIIDNIDEVTDNIIENIDEVTDNINEVN